MAKFELKLPKMGVNVDDVVQVGQVLAVIEIEGEDQVSETSTADTPDTVVPASDEAVQHIEQSITKAKDAITSVVSTGDRFYSPLVKNIAKAEGISQDALDRIKGTGKDGRVTKNDILDFIKNKGNMEKMRL